MGEEHHVSGKIVSIIYQLGLLIQPHVSDRFGMKCIFVVRGLSEEPVITRHIPFLLFLLSEFGVI